MGMNHIGGNLRGSFLQDFAPFPDAIPRLQQRDARGSSISALLQYRTEAAARRREQKWTHAERDLPFNERKQIAARLSGMDHSPCVLLPASWLMDRISFSALHQPGALRVSEMGNSGREHRQLRNFLSLLHEQLRIGKYLITAAAFGGV